MNWLRPEVSYGGRQKTSATLLRDVVAGLCFACAATAFGSTFSRIGVVDGSADPHGYERAEHDPCGGNADYPPEHRDIMTGCVTVDRRLSRFCQANPVAWTV